MTDGDSAFVVNVPEDPSEILYAERLNKIKGILSKETSIQLTLQFLYSHNNVEIYEEKFLVYFWWCMIDLKVQAPVVRGITSLGYDHMEILGWLNSFLNLHRLFYYSELFNHLINYKPCA